MWYKSLCIYQSVVPRAEWVLFCVHCICIQHRQRVCVQVSAEAYILYIGYIYLCILYYNHWTFSDKRRGIFHVLQNSIPPNKTISTIWMCASKVNELVMVLFVVKWVFLRDKEHRPQENIVRNPSTNCAVTYIFEMSIFPSNIVWELFLRLSLSGE